MSERPTEADWRARIHDLEAQLRDAQGQVAAVVKKTLDVLQPVLAAPMYVPPEVGSTEMRSVGLVDPINKYRRECEAALLSIDLPAASQVILAAAEREPGLRVSLNKGRWLVALLTQTMLGEVCDMSRPACIECNRWLDTEGHHEGCHYAAVIAWLGSSRAALVQEGE